MKEIINVGIVGFGLSGRYFFSPFIESHPKLNLHSIVSSQSELVKQVYPNAKLRASIDELLNDKHIDLIVVASPNLTHFEYAREALMHGKHVIVEKPFTITSSEAAELIELSEEKNKILAPFQNRRWDGDFITVKQLISEGQLGELVEYESHFDRYRPNYERVGWKNEPSAGSGVLYDLGAHLIDQALTLFGKPNWVFGNVKSQRANCELDDYFEVQLYYVGLKVILKAGMLVREIGPRFILHGRKGSFVKYGLDQQEPNLRKGILPLCAAFGEDDEAQYGLLHSEINGEIIREKIKTLPGNYMGYFDNVYNAILGKEALEVKPNDAKMIIEVIEKAYQSSKEKKAIAF